MKTLEIKGLLVSDDDAPVYDYFGMTNTSPQKVKDVVKDANGDDLEVIINSPGGYVDVGSEIYAILKDYAGNTTGKVVALAASAASIVAMGVKTLKIAPTAQMMIHNSAEMTSGDHRDLEHEASVLKTVDEGMANAYMLKTGLPKEQILNLMADETWMDAKKAKELGFADEIMFDENNQIAASYGNGLLPNEVINKVKNELNNKKIAAQAEKKQKENEIERAIAKLKLTMII
jgi:ATP-dependent protease ClpP protease subunit